MPVAGPGGARGTAEPEFLRSTGANTRSFWSNEGAGSTNTTVAEPRVSPGITPSVTRRIQIRKENAVAEQIKIDWKRVREKTGPYPPEAYSFVREGLAHTVEALSGVHEPDDAAELAENTGEGQHITGQQLSLGLREYAIEQYGMLARTVLERWHIRKTEDFGRIVYAMIDAGLMRRSESDNFEDFVGVYDFDDAFDAKSVGPTG